MKIFSWKACHKHKIVFREDETCEGCQNHQPATWYAILKEFQPTPKGFRLQSENHKRRTWRYRSIDE